MNSICLLINPSNNIKSNNIYHFYNALKRANYFSKIALAYSPTLSYLDSDVVAKEFQFGDNLEIGKKVYEIPLTKYRSQTKSDVTWMLAVIPPEKMIITLELLKRVETHHRVINSPSSVLFLDSKFLCDLLPQDNLPITYLSNDIEEIMEIISDSDIDWVLKPYRGSNGKDVFITNTKDPNSKTIVKNLTRDGTNKIILQRFILESTHQKEKRIIFANGEVVAHYIKKSKYYNRNVPETSILSKDEISFFCDLGNILVKMGAFFAGIDIIYPYIIDCNLMNPGGVDTFEKITGKNVSEKIVSLLFKDNY